VLLKIKKPITLISIIISLICFSLSVWQIKRLQWKKELINNIENAYNSESININTLSGDLNNFKFKKVHLEGYFLGEKSMFLGPRVNKDQVGYNLITPFLLKDDRYILINRGWIKEKIKSSKDDVSAACNDYLKVLGLVATGHAWIKVLEVSFKDYENNKQFYEEKIQTANFFFNRVLPKVDSYYTTAISGSKYIMDFKFN